MQKTQQKASFFLATTALESFWDTSKPLLFLGEWCRLYGRKSFWEPLGGEVVPNPWRTMEDVEASCSYASAVYEEVLSQLADAMNVVHQRSHGIRFWRILLGPWLLFYVHTHLDRFIRIRDLLAQYPDMTTLALSENSFVLPRDTMEFVDLCKGDLFNLQLYSRIFLFFGKTFPVKEAKEQASPKAVSKETLTPKLFLLKAANFAVKKSCRALKERPGIYYKSSYFAPEAELHLFFRTGGKFRPVGRKPIRGQEGQASSNLRKTVASFLIDGDEFRTFLQKTLPLDIPRCFLEGFAGLRTEADQCPVASTAIFTSNAYFYDEVFKLWTAASTENGALLLGSQHGGNYGVAKHLKLLDHELSICDRYYSWGWKAEGNSADTVVPFTAAKLAGRPSIGADDKKDGILLASTVSFRYLVQFPHLPEYFSEYIEWQKLFCTALDEKCQSALLVRLLAEDMGWDMKERWAASFPEVRLEQEGASANFYESLVKCRLFVADHISTTYIEALSADKPTVMFYNQGTYAIRPEAKRYFDLLTKAGILHETPEQAAQTVNEVYGNVESWWNDPDRQRARIDFCNVFGRTSGDAITAWSRELLSYFRPSPADKLKEIQA